MKQSLKKITMKKVLLLIICLTIIKDGVGQFVYKELPKEIVVQENNQDEYVIQQNIAKEKAYSLTNELPAGYVKDGTVDYTKYLQQGLDNHDIVMMPDFPILINENGLTLKSNSIVIFNNSSKIILSPSRRERYEVLRLHGVSNVKIFNANILGDREGHIGSTGEWGMGIAMRGAENILIYNPHIEKCWGDGIVLGNLDGRPTANVDIINARLDFNRRNGVAMASVRNIRIINPVISNTEGTLPMAGICIEPNNNREVCDNISIINPTTFNNANAGIQIGLSKLQGALPKQVNINIDKHVDFDSRIGLFIGGFNKPDKNSKMLGGNITVSSPSWNNNRNSLKTGESFEMGPTILLSDLKIKNVAPQQHEINVRKRINEKHRRIKIK